MLIILNILKFDFFKCPYFTSKPSKVNYLINFTIDFLFLLIVRRLIKNTLLNEMCLDNNGWKGKDADVHH